MNKHSLSTVGSMQYGVGAAELSYLIKLFLLVCLFVRFFLSFSFSGRLGRSAYFEGKEKQLGAIVSSPLSDIPRVLFSCLVSCTPLGREGGGLIRRFINSMPHCHHHNYVSYSICRLLAPLDSNRAACCY